MVKTEVVLQSLVMFLEQQDLNSFIFIRFFNIYIYFSWGLIVAEYIPTAKSARWIFTKPLSIETEIELSVKK